MEVRRVVRRTDTNGDYAYGLNDGHLECGPENRQGGLKDENRPREGEGSGFGQLLLADDLIVAVTEKS